MHPWISPSNWNLFINWANAEYLWTKRFKSNNLKYYSMVECEIMSHWCVSLPMPLQIIHKRKVPRPYTPRSEVVVQEEFSMWNDQEELKPVSAVSAFGMIFAQPQPMLEGSQWQLFWIYFPYEWRVDATALHLHVRFLQLLFCHAPSWNGQNHVIRNKSNG